MSPLIPPAAGGFFRFASRVRWSIIPAVLAGLFAASPGTTADGGQSNDETRISVVGVRAVGLPYRGERTMAPLDHYYNTSVAIQVMPAGGDIIALNPHNSTLRSFTDDFGTDLVAGGPGIKWPPRISPDGKAILIEIEGDRPPIEGASLLHLRGELWLKTASKKKTYRQENVPLKEGAKIHAGPIPFTITRIRERGDGSVSLRFEAQRDIYPLVAVRFLDRRGREIESAFHSDQRSSNGDQVVVHRIWKLERKPKTATIELIYWADMRTLKVPFNLIVSVGVESHGGGGPKDQ